jgi:hypothetical protein
MMYAQFKMRQIVVIATVLLLAGCSPSGTTPQKESERKADNVMDTSQDSTRSSCVNNLKQLGIGCRMYAKAHEGHFPDTIEALFPQYITDESLFRCPGAGSSGNSTLGTTGSSDYEMIPGMTEKSPAKAILIQEKNTGNHTTAGRNVLHVDGSVEFIQ